MFNYCNLQYFSSTLFNQYQKLYIIPTINEFWEQQKQRVWKEKAGQDVILSGDGRNDSPGVTQPSTAHTVLQTWKIE